MLVLGVIAFPIVEVVGASSFPRDLLGVQEQSATFKQMARFEEDASVVAEASKSSGSLLPEPLRKSDKIRTAQFMFRPDLPGGPSFGSMDRPGPPSPVRGRGFPEGSPPKFAPRKACLEDINRQMAIHGYTKSKLQLTDNQKAAWKAIEDATESAVGKLRVVCQNLPNDAVGAPGIVERSDFLEEQLAARLDLVRALKVPMQELLGHLSPDQRASLDAPPPFPPF
jgi:hypothetical protein